MTAEEIAFKWNVYLTEKPNKTQIEGAMREYAKQKCKEQREICAKIAKDKHTGGYVEYDVKNAPEPEFD